MKKTIGFLRKYGSYITFLTGVFVYVVLFIAGGMKVTPRDASPIFNDVRYGFTSFQAMFGKNLVLEGVKNRYFYPNWLGILGFFMLGIGIAIPTINKIKYRYRHLLGVLFLLFNGFTLFTLHKTAKVGPAFPDGTKIGLGAPLIVAGTIVMALAVFEMVLAQLPNVDYSKEEKIENK